MKNWCDNVSPARADVAMPQNIEDHQGLDDPREPYGESLSLAKVENIGKYSIVVEEEASLVIEGAEDPGNGITMTPLDSQEILFPMTDLWDQVIPDMKQLIYTYLCFLLVSSGLAFEWGAVGRRPDITHHEIAGLWKLTKPSPLKEFTVRPRQPKPPETEILLLLKEDGSFQQYMNDVDMDEDIDESWKRFQQLSKLHAARQMTRQTYQERFLKGRWDYVDGKLFLAADRPSSAANSAKQTATKTLGPSSATVEQQDTLLVGRVVATYETTLPDNPTVGDNTTLELGPGDASASTLVPVDTRLSVPLGTVKVGKFFYPRNHPSFFEQPMFQPRKRDVVCLRQVLGNLNARRKAMEEVVVEKYRCSDFYNKTFLLTSHPLRHQIKGRKKWSIKYNKFVYEKSEAARKAEEEEAQRMANIRVMQVRFFANNTFSTVAGMGQDVILRGKFDVIGQERDQLWMQVWRFGFGRSVSGSVYSEGRSLTQEDAKTYWGSIGKEEVGGDSHHSKTPIDQDEVSTSISEESNRIEVKGSVMLGWGLEPQPVARFIMREAREADITLADDEEEEEEEEDDDEEEEDRSFLERLGSIDVSKIDGDGIDASAGDAFQ